MTNDYLTSWVRGKKDEMEDLLIHLENNDISEESVREYLIEIKNSLVRKIRKL